MSDKVDDGGPAFPEHAGQEIWQRPGMTLRDWFAGQFLAGSMANSEAAGDAHETAEWAYKFADAMLAARGSQR